MANLLSERIAELRKGRGLTQEQLGQLVGVSAQAVSKWEKGGAPDVELLPAIADRLGVTIDGLFGREGSEIEDMPKKLDQWINAFPQEEMLDQLFHLLAADFLSPCSLGTHNILDVVGTLFESNCYAQKLPVFDGEPSWLRSYLNLEQGLCLAVLSDNFPLYLLLPEPPEGYEVHFASNEEYRELFSALSLEGSLEVLRYLYGQKESYYTAAAVARRIGLPLEAVETAMRSMEKCHLLIQRSLELEDGAVDAYVLHNNMALVPFLYFARWLMTRQDSWLSCWDLRERPILTPPDKQKEARHEKER